MAKASLVPLAILFVVILVLAAVGYIAYSIVQEVSNNTREKMEKRNVMFTKDGMTVGVKEMKDEDYKDRSQRLVFFFFFSCTVFLLSFLGEGKRHERRLMNMAVFS